MDLCLAAKRRLGTMVETQLWVQEGFGFGGNADGGLGGGADRVRGVYGRDEDGNVRLFKWRGYCSNHNLRDRA